jgi:hypothetical protein
VLAVTHLEAGPAEASRIAKVLPAGNTSTLAFLAAFRLANPEIGLGGGTIAGYAAALASLIVMEGITWRPDLFRLFPGLCVRRQTWGLDGFSWEITTPAGLRRLVLRTDPRARETPRFLFRRRPRHRGRFAPLVETLAW